MRWSGLSACLIGVALLGCGSGDTTASNVPGNDAAAGTSVGSGSLTGTESFPVTTVRWSDPGPFSERARLEVYLSNDAGCARPMSCTPYRELMLRLSSPRGGTITPGVYSIISPTDAGVVAGTLEAKLVAVKRTDGCSVSTQPGARGTVTIESIDATAVKGTFEIDVMLADGSEPHWAGRFDALRCP